MANKRAERPLGATDSGVRPGDFPLGSAASRAAARATLEAKRAGRKTVEIIVCPLVPNPDDDPRTEREWMEGADDTLWRLTSCLGA
jgi:hypothetical protein